MTLNLKMTRVPRSCMQDSLVNAQGYHGFPGFGGYIMSSELKSRTVAEEFCGFNYSNQLALWPLNTKQQTQCCSKTCRSFIRQNIQRFQVRGYQT